MNGRLKFDNNDELKEFVEDASNQASVTEKRAEVSERMVCALKMAEYMQKYIGEEFDGAICGVTNFGVFVELENTIEGLIRIENLPDDQYVFDEKSMKLKGRKHSFGFGDKIKVRVAAVDLSKRQIEFCEAFTTYIPKQRIVNNKLTNNISKKSNKKVPETSNLDYLKKYGRKPKKR